MVLRRKGFIPLGNNFPTAHLAAINPGIGRDVARVIERIVCGILSLLQKCGVFVVRHRPYSLALLFGNVENRNPLSTKIECLK